MHSKRSGNIIALMAGITRVEKKSDGRGTDRKKSTLHLRAEPCFFGREQRTPRVTLAACSGSKKKTHSFTARDEETNLLESSGQTSDFRAGCCCAKWLDKVPDGAHHTNWPTRSRQNCPARWQQFTSKPSLSHPLDAYNLHR